MASEDTGSAAPENAAIQVLSDDTTITAKRKALLIPEKAVYYISLFVNCIGVTIVVAMMLLTVAEVIMRYFFNAPINGSLEITEFMMAIVVGLALAYTGVKKRHVVVDVVITRLNSRTQAVMNAITYFLSLIAFAVIAWRSAVYAASLQANGTHSSVLSIPVYPFVYIVAIGSGIFCLVLLYNIYEFLDKIITQSRWLLTFGLLVLIALVVVLFSLPIFEQSLRGHLGPGMAGIISIILLIILLFAGMPIGATMAFLALMGIAYVAGLGPAFYSVGSSPYGTAASYDLSVLPLFVLMGAYCFHSGLSKDLYYTAYRWIGHLPGGLAMATIAACAGFAAVSGSSLATVATIGMVALPEMKKYRYNPGLAAGCIAAGGGIGILIPPSVILVIYGILTEQSIGKLFLAGFIPGILQALLFMITVYIICRRNPAMGQPGPSSSLREKAVSLKGTWGILVLFIVVIGGIYFGVLTPTEAAGVGAFGAFLFVLGRRKMTWKNFWSSLKETSETTGMAFIILIGAILLGNYLALTRLPNTLSTFVSGLPLNRYIIMALIILLYFFLGTFMSSMALVVLTVPIFSPVVTALGFDLLWFGIIIVTIVEFGQITPPVGINVFVIQGVAKDIPMYTIFKGIVPFLVADVVLVVLLTALPQIALFLPGFMK